MTATDSKGNRSRSVSRGGGGVHPKPIRVCAVKRGRDFDAPDLEPGIHFRDMF